MAALRRREDATALSAPRSRPLPRPRTPPVRGRCGGRYRKGTLPMHWRRVSRNFSLFVEAEDDRQEYGEVRLRALGHVDEAYYLVVYTWRGEHRRIISAWKGGDRGTFVRGRCVRRPS